MEQSFRKDISSLDEVFFFLGESLLSFRTEKQSAYAITLAVEEIFTNLVKYNPDKEGRITIEIESNGVQVVVTITGRNVEPFDPTGTPDVDTSLPLEKRKIGGLGIHLAKQLMDDIRYSYADRCSRITLTKHLEH